jgi:DNA polymerase I-like protein with 3'-5' exonuclease and polymerase domains
MSQASVAAALEQTFPALTALGAVGVNDDGRAVFFPEIVAALDASLNATEKIVKIPRRAKPRRKKKGDGKQLMMLDAEPILRKGDCPGGTYYYLDDLSTIVGLLDHWSANKAWAAVDIETGVAWRERTNPDTGEVSRYYVEVIDPYTCPIYLVSISVEPGTSVVFDVRPFKEDETFLASFRRFLTDCQLVAHGSMFEQCFFSIQFGVTANIVYDTMLVHQLMTAGLDIGSGLGDMMDRYCGVKLDKKWQKFFLALHPDSPIPNDCIAYSAGDVCQLLALAKMLETELLASGMYEVWTRYEQPFMQWIAQAKIHGISVDPEFFKQLQVELGEKQEALAEQFKQRCPGVLISSPVQIKKWFEAQGIKMKSADKEMLEKLLLDPTVGDVAQLLLSFRKVAKMRSTYVMPILGDLPSAVTGRLHPNWGQLFTATGRMNCNEPNFQNWPSRDEYVKIRGGCVARDGHLLGYCDYSQFEVRAMADMAGEDQMISVFEDAEKLQLQYQEYCLQHQLPAFTAGLRDKDAAKWKDEEKALVEAHPQLGELIKALANCDFHRRTASMLFGVPVEQVTKDQRQKAKTITFAKPYGAGPKKIAQQAGISVDEATRLFKDYDLKFPKLAAFLQQMREAAKKGCTFSPAGRRRSYQIPTLTGMLRKVKEIQRGGGSEWEDMKEQWYSDDPGEIAKKILNSKMGAVEREGMNHPIQACNADATKYATILAAPRLRELHPECVIIAWVHDEIILTAPEALIDQATAILREAMIESALEFLKHTPVEVSVSTGKCWGK